ncbi:MAG: hypothetical protein KJP12_06860 [Acidimicrobiia bacterium]|nr:hypothetical protein [Acidimicrobiia bacterium]MBT8214930.1 hypothetical protein [Acidimicrobiia bacterium]NNK91970.1 hypothetical protein [Acidimicrobiia bacterium]
MTLWWIPGLAGVWTLIIWGSRVRLLTGDEAAKTEVWIRIIASLALGAAVMAVAIIARNGGPGRWGLGVVAGFAVWMTYVWGSSAINVFVNDHSTAFRVVHTVLAVVSIGLAVAALVVTAQAD